jgi:hypothetical protein
MFTIIRDREIPKNNRGRGGSAKYPLSQMNVGDCFDVSVNPNNDYTYSKLVARLSSAAYSYRTTKKPLTRWSVRLDRDLQRVTVWRIK